MTTPSYQYVEDRIQPECLQVTWTLDDDPRVLALCSLLIVGSYQECQSTGQQIGPIFSGSCHAMMMNAHSEDIDPTLTSHRISTLLAITIVPVLRV